MYIQALSKQCINTKSVGVSQAQFITFCYGVSLLQLKNLLSIYFQT